MESCDLLRLAFHFSLCIKKALKYHPRCWVYQQFIHLFILASIPQYGCITICLSIYPLNIWVGFQFLAITSKPNMDNHIQVLRECNCSYLQDKHVGGQLLRHIGVFNFIKKLPNYFPQWLYHFTFPTAMDESSIISNI